MKFGIMGYGRIARKFVKSIEGTNGGSIGAIASKSVKEDDEYLLKHQDVKVYRNYDELLEDKDIEAVYIALPHLFHKEWIIKCLNKDKAILVEKPLVIDSKDYDEISECLAKSKGYCLEAFKTKFNDGLEGLKKDLSLIGKIESIEANFCNNVNRDNSYLFDVKQGGALNDVGIYIIGFINEIADSEISNIESSLKMDKGIDLEFKAKLTYANGIVGIGEGSIDYDKERYALIKGTKGEIYIPNYNRIIDYVIKIDNQEITRTYPIVGDDMTKEIQALIDDVNNHLKENKKHSLRDARKLQEIIEEIRKEGLQ